MILAKYPDGSKVGLGIGNIQGRKQTALYVFRSDKQGARLYPLAYFRDTTSASEAADIIELMIGTNPQDTLPDRMDGVRAIAKAAIDAAMQEEDE